MPQIDSYDVCMQKILKEGGSCIPRGESFVDAYATNNNVCYHILPASSNSKCNDGEVAIDGYCYKIDSYATITCPKNYVLESNNCYRNVRRTCNNHCTSESWSPWSEWSTTKVIAGDSTEVQTKVETIER
jgi:hypothetical protein